jgi:hypothetical protein
VTFKYIIPGGLIVQFECSNVINIGRTPVCKVPLIELSYIKLG